MLKNKSFLFFCIISLFSMNTLFGWNIYNHELTKTIDEIIDTELKRNDINANQIPSQLLPEYNQTITQVNNMLLKKMIDSGTNYLSYYVIQDEVWRAINSFVQNIKRIVLKDNLENEIKKISNKFLADNNIDPYNAQSTTSYEYNNANRNIKNTLNNTLVKEHREYVRKKDIEKEATKEFQKIVNKIKKQDNPKTRGFFEGWNLFSDVADLLWGNSNNQDNTNTSDYNWNWNSGSSNKIYRESLAYKVKDVANKQLKINGINPYEIPNKLKSEYNEKIENIKNKLNNLMKRWNRDYVNECEINDATKQELEPFIKNMSTVVLDKNLEQKTKECIAKELHLNNIYEIPYHATSAYHNDTQRILRKLRQIMKDDKREYARTHEIEKIVKTELRPTINEINYGDIYPTFDTETQYYIAPTETQPNFEGEICSICQDNYIKNERISELNCGHWFHEECINTWFATELSERKDKSCPLCRNKKVYAAKIYTKK